MKKILALMAHCDDEVNCSGLLYQNHKNNGENQVVCFTGNEKRKKELEQSCIVLGAKHKTLGFKEFEIRSSNELHQQLVNIIQEFKPNVIIVQSNDYHPDHKNVFDISMTAIQFAAHWQNGWKPDEILEIEATGLLTYPDKIIDVTQIQDIRKKAFLAHASEVTQKCSNGFYLDFFEAKARIRGVQIGVKYGEAYRVRKLSIKGNFN